jgi:hypothetical protein
VPGAPPVPVPGVPPVPVLPPLAAGWSPPLEQPETTTINPTATIATERLNAMSIPQRYILRFDGPGDSVPVNF